MQLAVIQTGPALSQVRAVPFSRILALEAEECPTKGVWMRRKI